jgi:exodeoxyribonuclease VII small subunit
MAKTEIGYSEAIRQVEEILEKLNNEELDVDKLADEVKRAAGLIALCREKLRKAEAEVARVIQKESAE